MFPSTYQLYNYQHGLSAAEQRAADMRAGEAEAALADAVLHLARAVRLGKRRRSARRAPDAPTVSVPVLSAAR